MRHQASDDLSPRILIFDSGVGGLSITEAIRQLHPHCTITYASDNAAFPYGTKSAQELINRVDRVLHKLLEITPADIVVVACNTASTVVLPRIRDSFAIPIVGVVPAIKPAAALSQTKVIGLLATPATVKRQYTCELIDKFAGDCQIIPVSSSELVEMAEDKLRDKEISRKSLEAILFPLKTVDNLDTIILACTHFPLLKTELREVLPDITYWIDSGEAIARRVGYWLDQIEFKSGERNLRADTDVSFFTAETPEVKSLMPHLQEHHLSDVRFIDVT